MNSKKGFTLIELLVVVLIIGILAAVALLQYQFAIDKARVSSYLPKIQDIVKAEQVYHMANGKYTLHFTDLDIDLTHVCPDLVDNELKNCTSNMALGLNGATNVPQLFYCSTSECYWSATSRIITVEFDLNTTAVTSCQVNDNSSRGEKLCKWLLSQ